MPLSKRVEEVHALINIGMFKDASTLANANNLLHCNLQFRVGEDKNNDPPPHYDQNISNRFDNLFLHLRRTFDKSINDLVPETSAEKINEASCSN